jgi:hypothetical protein
MNDDMIKDIKWQLSNHRTNKILSGRGLEDDPEWVTKYEELLDAHRDD